jgi:ankyrin repeat protein
MSENEFEVTAYFEDRQKLERIKDALSDFEAGRQETIMAIMKEHGFKETVNFEELMNIQSVTSDKSLDLYYDTPVHSNDGSLFAKFLSKACAAVLVKEYNTQVAEEYCYGFLSGRERELDGMIKSLTKFDPDIALYEAVWKGKTKAVKTLLVNGADPNVSYDMPLPIMCVVRKRKGLLDIVLQAGADPNHRAKNGGKTLLLAAAERSSISFLELALQHGADPNQANYEGITPLIKAVEYGHLESTKRLIDAKAMIDAKDNEGMTALMWACARNRLDIVKFLLSAGADIKAVDHSGKPIMAYAYGQKCEEILIDAGESYYIPDSEYTGRPEEDIFTAIRYNHEEKVDELLANGLNPNEVEYEKRWTPLNYAFDRPAILRRLIENGADIHRQDEYGSLPIYQAAFLGYSSAVDILILHGADPNEKKAESGETPLHNVKDFDTALVLLENGGDLSVKNNRGKTPFEELIGRIGTKSSANTVDLFLKHGALEKLDDKESIIETAIYHNSMATLKKTFELGLSLQKKDYLSIALSYNNFEAVEFFLNLGADCNQKSDRDWPPETMPINQLCKNWVNEKKRKAQAVYAHLYQLMIEKGADVDTPENYGITPIFYFQSRKGFETQTLDLIERGVNINRQADGLGEFFNICWEVANGITPLMIAAAKGLFENVKILLEAGADLSLESKEGKTALDFAEEYRKKKVAKLLKEFDQANH